MVLLFPWHLQVYYLYRRPIHAQSTMPTLWLGAFRLLRLICIRERISLVHCHQAFSTLGGEALVQARTMGYKVRVQQLQGCVNQCEVLC
jgi:phosphatidylinositol glycan class A protein